MTYIIHTLILLCIGTNTIFMLSSYINLVITIMFCLILLMRSTFILKVLYEYIFTYLLIHKSTLPAFHNCKFNIFM